jgi:hypothetical protein
MPWAVRLSLPAQAHLFSLAMREAEIVSFNLFRLAEDPVALSTPPSGETPLGQEYRFRHALNGAAINYTVVFRYDEQCEVLLIVRIQWDPARP